MPLPKNRPFVRNYNAVRTHILMSLDPQVILAEATSAAGNAIATFLLGKEGAGAVPGLQNLASLLPKIPVGAVGPASLGFVTAQLNGINAKATAASAPSQLLSQIGSVIALVSNEEAAASGGAMTVNQALLVAAATNVAQGIGNALAFFAGEQAALQPNAVPPPIGT
jgi:hypothetical protein